MDLYFNKYVDGYPYLCRSVDVSATGLLAETFMEPDGDRTAYPLELRLPHQRDSLWVWARSVSRRGRRHALEFVGMDDQDRLALERYLGRC